MSAELPRCVVCRVTVQPGTTVVFQPDGRVHHAECPSVVCPLCSREILPGTPIRRDGEAPVHSNCWINRERHRAAVAARPDDKRRQTVLTRLAVRAVPQIEPTKIWSGMSAGSLCGACTEPIPAGQIEYELQFANVVSLRLHRACYFVWQEEREKSARHISGGSASSSLSWTFDHGIQRRIATHRAAVDELLIASIESCRHAAEIRALSRAVRATCKSLRGETLAARLRPGYCSAAREVI